MYMYELCMKENFYRLHPVLRLRVLERILSKVTDMAKVKKCSEDTAYIAYINGMWGGDELVSEEPALAKYNTETQLVDVFYYTCQVLHIDISGVRDQLYDECEVFTKYMEIELDRLIYENTLLFANLILSGILKDYLWIATH